MPDAKKYLDIDGLTEYHESAGHSADIADGSITTAKLAPMAVTASKIADGAVTSAKLYNAAVTGDKLALDAVTGSKIHSNSVDTRHIVASAIQTFNIMDTAVTYSKIDPNVITLIQAVSLIAADSQTDKALTTLNMKHRTLTPAQMLVDNEYANSRNRLCWINGTIMEVAAITFFGDLQSGQITLYAKGINSTASGKLGIDTSWTIAASN